VVDKVALGQVFSEYFGFPCQSSFHQILHHDNHPGQATIGQSVADVPSGPSWTSPPLSELKKKQRTKQFLAEVEHLSYKFGLLVPHISLICMLTIEFT
jgi:hypothetical protein